MRPAGPAAARLKLAVSLLTLTVYLLFLTGSYFFGPAAGLLTGAAGLALLGCAAALVWLQYRPTGVNGRILAERAGLPLLLVLALAAGAFLRFQALKNAGSLPLLPESKELAVLAWRVIVDSNWQAGSLVQPPLYLYLGAALTEWNFLRQASAGLIDSPGDLKPENLAVDFRYVNLLLGLVAVGLTYRVAARLWSNAITGLVAAWILATLWLAYQATGLLRPQTLAACLVLLSFWWLLEARQSGRISRLVWSGGAAGLATAAAYGSGWLLVPLLAVAGLDAAKEEKYKRSLAAGLGWLAAFTLAAPGWLFSLHSFVAGLAAIGPAPPGAPAFYFRTLAANDAGVLLLLVAGGGLALVRPARWLPKFSFVAAFPLLYVFSLLATGPALAERPALIAPFLAVLAAWPVSLLADWLAVRFGWPANDGWRKIALTWGLTLLFILTSVAVRRLS